MLRLFSVLLMVFVSGCATVPRTSTVPAETTLEGVCNKYAVRCSWDGIAQTVTIDHRDKKIQAMVGSRVILIGDTKVMLSAPLIRRHGSVIVPPDFERIVFVPEKPAAPGAAFKASWAGKVVVDAGHGGKDPGAVGFSGVKEKEIILDIALRLAKDLKAAGVDVILTRDTDEFLSLQERTILASRSGVDLFISVHANASKSRRARGIEVYYAAPLSKDDKTDPQRIQNEKKLCGTLNMRRDSLDLRRIVADLLYGHKFAETARLADMVSRGLGRDLGQESRGSKMARFYVLRNTLVPAILIEVGFISNPREAMQLKNAAYRQQIADAVTKSVMRYVYAAGI